MTRDQKIYRCSYWLASAILGLVLLAGFEKLLYPDEFALAVYRYRILPDVLVNAAALYLAWLETLCGVCLLLVPRFRVAALWIVLATLLIVTAGVATALLRGTPFGCGCFDISPLAQPMDWLVAVRNGALILLTVLALLGKKRAET